MLQEKELSNDPFFRKISDYLDDKLDWKNEKQEQSGTRGFLHGIYHTMIGTFKYFANNIEGSSNEYSRAKIQFNRMKTQPLPESESGSKSLTQSHTDSLPNQSENTEDNKNSQP